MRRRWLLVGTVVAVVLAVGLVTTLAVAGGDDESSPTARRVAGPLGTLTGTGEPVPDFELRTMSGRTLRLSDLRGRPVIINFWASWCAPCREEFPQLSRALRTYRADRLAVVGVSFRDITSDARAFARERDARWPLLVDRDGAVAQAWGVRSIPHSFFIDRDGTLVSELFGVTDRAVLDDAIERILVG